MKKLLLLVVTMFLWASCSNQDEPVNQAPEATESQTASRYLSPSEAVKRASEAYENMFGKGSRSTLSGQAYLYNASTGSRSFGTDSVLYVVNFDEGGFAVVPAYRYDDTEAYAIGEHSTFDTSQNPAAAAYVDNLSDYASNLRDSIKIQIPKPEPQPIIPWFMGEIPEGWSQDPKDPAYWFHTYTTESVSDKSVASKWDELMPYNADCPIVYSPTYVKRKAPAGCVAVAIGQICGYYRIPANSIDGYKLDWDKMLEEPYINRLSEEYQNQITRLLAQIGSRAKLIYGFDETVGNIKDYYPAIKALGYPNAKIVSNLTNCIDYVQNVGPCIVRSDDKNNPDKSNAWVIDGIKVVSDNKYRAHCESINDEKPYMIVEKTYIQCNWGDGGYADGYFLAREKRYSDASLTITGQNEWKTTEWTISSQGFTTSTMQFIINFK